VDTLSSNGDKRETIFAPTKAEEIVCKLLKPPGSHYKDCVMCGVDLFWAAVDQLGNATITGLKY
jgi:hypothetical protein